MWFIVLFADCFQSIFGLQKYNLFRICANLFRPHRPQFQIWQVELIKCPYRNKIGQKIHKTYRNVSIHLRRQKKYSTFAPDLDMKNRREDILQAAEEEFARNGYEGAKMSNIARRVGVTHVLLYYHFKTKENLFNELLQQKIMSFVQSVLPSDEAQKTDFIGGIDNLIARNFDFMEQNKMLVRLLVNELTLLPSFYEVGHATYDPYIDRLQTALNHEADAERIVPTDARKLVLTICSMNIMSVLVMPALATLLPEQEKDGAKLLAQRKADNIRYIHTLLGI